MSSEVAVEMKGDRWKRYPAYRDSGVEWIGEVPEGWGASKIIRYAYLKTGGTPDRKNMAYWENGTINWISSGEVNKKKIFETNNKITLDGLANSNAMILPINSIMVALNGQGKTKGTVAILKIESSCNQSLAAFICDEKKLHFNYLFYYLESKYKELRGLVGDNSRDGLSLGHLKSIYSPLPPIIKQRAIAAFLDRETGRIDTLIEKKERQVELLQEKRAALISHAVTKGLDPDVKMKDSGVEWLGEVPKEWSASSVKHYFHIQLGKMLQNKPDSVEDMLVPYAKALHVLWGNVVTDDLTEMWAHPSDIQQYGIEAGDLLVCEGGEVGRTGIVTSPPKQCIIQNALHRVRAKKSNELRFLLYVLYAVSSSTWLDVLCNKATIAHFTREKFADLKIPVPPHPEQRLIVTFLDRETGCIDTLTAKLSESISKLHEYRTALISAAVTGKIDVREGV